MRSTSAAIPISEPVSVSELAELTAALTTHRGCRPVTPYRAGFEDARYEGEYRNPYRAGTTAYADYEQGIQDGNRERRKGWL
jgi:hypothetical protein